MSINRLVYDWPSNKVAAGGWSQSGGTVSGVYTLTNIDDVQPWNPTIFTANPTRLVKDMTTATRVDMVSFNHTNWDAAAVVKIEMNATDSWGSPTVSVTMAIPTVGPFGFPGNPFVDLTAVAGYTTSGFRYLAVTIVSGQSTLLSIGDIRLTGIKRQLDYNINWGCHVRTRYKTKTRPTDGNIRLGISRGTRERWFSGNIQTTDAGAVAIDDWVADCSGSATPGLLIPDPNVNEAWLANWGEEGDFILNREMSFLDNNNIPVGWAEVGRGLRP